MAGVLVALLACKQSGEAGAQCERDRDCKQGLLCESGLCLDADRVELLRAAERGPRETAAPSPAPAAPSLEPAPEPAASVSPLDPWGLFVGIGQRSSPPTTAEWNAVTREIDVRHSTALRCETKFLREWLRVSCRGDKVQDLVVTRRDGLAKGEVLTYAKAGSVTSLVLPIRGSLEVTVDYRWSDIGTRTLTVRHAAGAKVPELYFDGPP